LGAIVEDFGMSTKSLIPVQIKTTDPILKNIFIGLKDKKENLRTKNIDTLYDYVNWKKK
jgi:hypothetical protein